MQCVIVAAGEGRRMRPLTLNVPKPLLEVAGKPLLFHLMDSLPPEIDEIILVIGYLGEQIRSRAGDHYGKIRIRYVVQEKAEGTYRALELCRPFLKKEKFMVLYADDLHSLQSLQKMVDCRSLVILAARAEHPERFGVIQLKEDGSMASIVEKPAQPKGNFVSSGPYVLDPKIFDYAPPVHSNGEYYLPTAVNRMAQKRKIMVVEGEGWIPIGLPEDLAIAEEKLSRGKW